MTIDLKSPSRRTLLGVAAAGAGGIAAPAVITSSAWAQGKAKPIQLLNVSYDPTRELYEDVNKAFADWWRGRTNQTVTIRQSHGGSGAQSRAVIDGLQADVATLALAYDIDVIADKAKSLPKTWQGRLPQNSTPYTSTIVFLVKKGNPWKIRDWGDLTRKGVEVITPNPKTSGGARWNYLAAWAWALKQPGGTPATAKTFVQNLFKQVPVLDTGARGSTNTFVQRGIGDVLLAWENEAYLSIRELGPDKFDIVYPSMSILAEPPVALIDKVVDKKKTRDQATGYLNFLYSPLAQELIAKNYYRPRNAEAAAKYASRYKKIPLVEISAFGGWRKAQADHFGDGAIFDQIYRG
jgi:sulfate/thiosulfate transport system substrate-binding protein